LSRLLVGYSAPDLNTMRTWIAAAALSVLLSVGAVVEMEVSPDSDVAALVESAAGADDDCVDEEERCPFWAEVGECAKNPSYMLVACVKSCDRCPPGGMAAARARPDCKNHEPRCGEWAEAGECANNPSYMLKDCAAACKTCHLLDAAVRCRPPPNQQPAMQPGDLNATMAAAVADFPDLGPRAVSRDPWVVVFDTFLSDAEVDALVRGSAKEGFQASVDAGPRQPDGSFKPIVSSARTSETAWCVTEQCSGDPDVRNVTKRIEAVTRVPYTNSEYLQVLHYEPGQYYVSHHDYIPDHNLMPCGPRLYTLFLYLSDVEEGGATKFNHLGFEVQPKKGRAVLWPSVLDADPFAADRRTQHEAMPVARGAKYAANAWIHMYDFKTPFKVGCTG